MCRTSGSRAGDQDSSDEQVPWERHGPGKVVITFETKDVPTDWVDELQKGVAARNRSACLDTKLVETCQPDTNCVTVTVGDGAGADGNFDAVESNGFTKGGHIDLQVRLPMVSGQMSLFTKWGTRSALRTG